MQQPNAPIRNEWLSCFHGPEIHAKIQQQVVLISSIFKSSLATHHHHHVFIPLHSLWPNLYKLIPSPPHSTNLPTNIRKSWFWLLETQEINNTMSLNCLTCSQLLQRTDSYGELFAEKEYTKICKQVDRSLSSNMSSSTSKCELPKGGAVAKVKAGHRRNYSTGDVPYPPGSPGPTLVRSSGMRRNWSFEDVAETQDQGVSCH